MGTFVLIGSGSHALTAGTGQLHLHIDALPTNAGFGSAEPTNYFKVGQIRAGDGTSWWRAEPIDADDCWMGVPKGATQVGYSIDAGGQVTVTEVALDNPFVGPAGPAGPAGPSGSIAFAYAEITSPVSMPTANAYVDVMSLSLAAGTWFVWYQLYMNPSVNTQMSSKLWDGSTVYADGGQNTNKVEMHHGMGRAVLATGTTLKVSVTNTNNGGSVEAAPLFNSGGAHASHMFALQVA